ncbi:MAG: pyridoxamine 5'-phosphate oxidase family protein [Devosiaceae bacterium]|nr:pyridoxamine 5'-phosphate oxidase family protein [Devosiaceae bacterium MH13]
MAREFPSDVAFTPAVKAIQQAKECRGLWAGVEQNGGWRTQVDDRLAQALRAAHTSFLATASADGQPYVQHRGGLPGFIKVLSPTQIGFADLAGNQQYITLGNLTENPGAQLFLIDYARRSRIKVWGNASYVEDDDLLMEHLVDPVYEEWPERAIVLDIVAWDINCPQHIPQLFPRSLVEDLQVQSQEAQAVQAQTIQALQAENAELRDEIALLHRKGWAREGCAGAGDFDD